jgi:hypothetical protein
MDPFRLGEFFMKSLCFILNQQQQKSGLILIQKPKLSAVPDDASNSQHCCQEKTIFCGKNKDDGPNSTDGVGRRKQPGNRRGKQQHCTQQQQHSHRLIT